MRERYLARAQAGAAAPTNATIELLWWGARNGARCTIPPAGRRTPAAEWTIVACSEISGSSSGNKPGMRWASIVLPDPGGPTSNMW